MKLHLDQRFFEATLRATAQHTGINLVFVEKDYWITLVLNQLAKSGYAAQCVFKGGTSLSKGYGLINRFSEDVDIAVINENLKTNSEIKTLLRAVEKEVTNGLLEKDVSGVSSKGSRFRKSVFEYNGVDHRNTANTLIVEVNSFANPFPYHRKYINSLVYEFLKQTDNETYIDTYQLQPFEVNILSKEQTMLEKLVALVRCSYDENPVQSIASKIRHFYDLYYLVSDAECKAYIQSEEFTKKFNEILLHDKEVFDNPVGWKEKSIADSPLLSDFEILWKRLKNIYSKELTALAYSEVPDEQKVASNFKYLISLLP